MKKWPIRVVHRVTIDQSVDPDRIKRLIELLERDRIADRIQRMAAGYFG